MPGGNLTIVGTGIRAISHITNEARVHLERADFLFYLVTDPLTESWILDHNGNARSLMSHYHEGTPRLESYRAMVEEVLACARKGVDVCCAFYGHPSVFVYPSHELVRRCANEDLACEVCPGISADGCLYADLGVDPAKDGLISYEATDFLIFDRPFSVSCGLVLWQIGVIGDLGYHRHRDVRRGLHALTEKLLGGYAPDQPCVVYQAATLPLMPCSIERVRLDALPKATVTAISTLYVPPAAKPALNAAVAASLGLSIQQIESASTAFQRRT